MDRIAIALGSNLGDRRAHLDFAVSRLSALLANFRVSSYHETDPVGAPSPQPPFLNAAAAGETAASAREVLATLMAIFPLLEVVSLLRIFASPSMAIFMAICR